METINNVATVAAKAVWGSPETNKEPVSGVQGDVTKGEPYDAGNLDPEQQKKVESRLGVDGANDSPAEKKVESSPVAGDTTSGQNTTASPDDEPEVDVTGPGPRPIADIAREHGGDAGRDHDEPSKPQKSEDTPSDPPKETTEAAKSSGTGEEHVKTTGLAADGGDFDATKPGAGEEADRLLDQKGVAHGGNTPDSKPAPQGSETNGSTDAKKGKSRRSIGERIKAKFHKR